MNNSKPGSRGARLYTSTAPPPATVLCLPDMTSPELQSGQGMYCHKSRAAGSSALLPVPPSPLPPCGLPSSLLLQPRSSSVLRRLDRSPPYRTGSDISPTYRPPAGLGPFSLSPLYCLHILLLSDACISLWLSLHILLLFPHCSCLCVLSPVAASRVLAAQQPSAIRCFPWA